MNEAERLAGRYLVVMEELTRRAEESKLLMKQLSGAEAKAVIAEIQEALVRVSSWPPWSCSAANFQDDLKQVMRGISITGERSTIRVQYVQAVFGL